ncbi:MAG TPA: O-antigen ligase family protein [Parapedobacter sp.]|uniref:O-antigen ligase family protein n=1 Tax=Parapedobacter sp. TaxID=1958893 RepID=UPI002BBB1734|nr:O-antigen ligase family protein [Parapedobacter sp.]HWK57538.1 O-antigen ligase family protein [Parapedobacter sp.]
MKAREKYGVIFMVLGYGLINLSLLDNSTRQALAFSSFGVAAIFALPENLYDIFKRRKAQSYGIAIFVLLYCFFIKATLGTYGEYGANKYPYLLIVVILTFFSFPTLLKNDRALELFSKLLFYVSLVYCLFAIFYSNPNEGRRSEMGLNPAIMARLCMIAGIYIASVIYYKGVNALRVLILLLSISAVFFTATKTPVPVFIASFYFVTARKLNLKKGLRILFFLTIGLIALYLVLTYVVPEQYSSRILSPEGLSYENQSTEGNRLQLYGLALAIIQDNFWGVGFGGFAKFHSFIVAPHNLFLEAAVEMGTLIALLFLLWSMRALLIVRKIPLENGIYSTFVSILYVYSFISMLFAGELTIQSFLFYLTGTYLLFHYRKMGTGKNDVTNTRNSHLAT